MDGSIHCHCWSLPWIVLPSIPNVPISFCKLEIGDSHFQLLGRHHISVGYNVLCYSKRHFPLLGLINKYAVERNFSVSKQFSTPVVNIYVLYNYAHHWPNAYLSTQKHNEPNILNENLIQNTWF